MFTTKIKMIFKKYQGQAQAPEVPFSLCSWVNSSVSKGLTITQFYQIPKKQSVYLHSAPELKIQYPCPTAGLMDRHTSTPKETPKNPLPALALPPAFKCLQEVKYRDGTLPYTSNPQYSHKTG